MAVDLIRYDLLVQEALRGVVRRVLSDTARDGLPGDHHFYISFRTHARGVRLSSRMRGLYPDEMTIILQHQFWDLNVTEESFEVGLSFRNVPEMLLIPFDAVTRFFDPSVGFEARFAVEDEITDGAAEKPEALRPQLAPASGSETSPQPLPAALAAREPEDAREAVEAGKADGSSELQSEPKVVSIDAFRKKN
ncbi:MAG TPA: ClpXP protease specificity-enhancing factor SspB [Methylocella sp.]|nr:ClpXP protease specificity-enhancing factor SspB [Methylocella sp.]